MTQVPVWFDRKFEFTFPIEHFPNLLARLRGTPARLEETMRSHPHDTLIAKPEGKWSAQEHAGHLLDLFNEWTPDPVVRRKILADNPTRLYGFPD